MFVHRYSLHMLGGVTRTGALLRAGDGFADVHPWPELGDAPLDEQLALLARGETTRLTRASLKLAAADGNARRQGVSLFEGLTIPLSHWPGNEPPDGFDTVKLKRVMDVPDGLRIRLDFNARLSAEEFLSLAETLPGERIDFVEDPCPYDVDVWREIRLRTGLRLAYDTPTGATRGEVPADGPFDVMIHKPALRDTWPAGDDVVVTSYMDHAVGQFFAAWVAATHPVNPRCGLMTHVLYEPDAFFDRVERDGARLLPPRGTGIGFDDLLERLPWKSIG